METLHYHHRGHHCPGAPHSLGKLIEWKQEDTPELRINHTEPPHSLGKLIEWKPLLAV